MELSNERYWTTDGKPRDLETTFLQDFFSVFKRSGALSTANRTILGDTVAAAGGNSGSRAKEARKNALSIESREAHPPRQDSGYIGRSFASSQSNDVGKDEKNYDSDADAFGRSTRFRKISFAGPRQPDAASAV